MQKKVNGSRVSWGKESAEMSGVSEHLYNNDAEVLSEDQLDRLLLQAKKTRAGGYDR